MNSAAYNQIAAPDRSIYSRKVPGISNGELVGALYEDQRKPHGQPHFNDAFSRTSPAIYQHHQNAAQYHGAAAAAGSALPAGVYIDALANGSVNSSGNSSTANRAQIASEFAQMPPPEQPQPPLGGTPISFESADEPEIDDNRSVRRRVAALDASVREYHAKEIERHGQVLESLDALHYSLNIRTWILVAFGVVLLALLILLLCMLSKHMAVQKGQSTTLGDGGNGGGGGGSASSGANFLRDKDTASL